MPRPLSAVPPRCVCTSPGCSISPTAVQALRPEPSGPSATPPLGTPSGLPLHSTRGHRPHHRPGLMSPEAESGAGFRGHRLFGSRTQEVGATEQETRCRCGPKVTAAGRTRRSCEHGPPQRQKTDEAGAEGRPQAWLPPRSASTPVLQGRRPGAPSTRCGRWGPRPGCPWCKYFHCGQFQATSRTATSEHTTRGTCAPAPAWGALAHRLVPTCHVGRAGTTAEDRAAVVMGNGRQVPNSSYEHCALSHCDLSLPDTLLSTQPDAPLQPGQPPSRR